MKSTIWSQLAQILLGVGTSYLSAKLSNKDTGWVSGGYRDELISNVAATALSTATQQVAKATQPTA